MKNFRYFKPETIEDAAQILGDLNGKAMALSGGTDLLVRMRSRIIQPEAVVDIKGIKDLALKKEDKTKGLTLGSTVTIGEIENWELIQKRYPVLSQAAATLGGPQVRNKATVGGNLCNASPSADMSPALMVLNASVNILSKDGNRNLPLEEFFRGPGETAMDKGEILTSVQVPKMLANSHAVYIKLGRRKAMEIPVAAVAVMMTLDDSFSKCLDIRIAMGAVAPTPLRAKQAENLIRGKIIDDAVIQEVAEEASRECSPISDVRASAWYRQKAIEGLVKKAIKQSEKTIREESNGSLYS